MNDLSERVRELEARRGDLLGEVAVIDEILARVADAMAPGGWPQPTVAVAAATKPDRGRRIHDLAYELAGSGSVTYAEIAAQLIREGYAEDPHLIDAARLVVMSHPGLMLNEHGAGWVRVPAEEAA